MQTPLQISRGQSHALLIVSLVPVVWVAVFITVLIGMSQGGSGFMGPGFGLFFACHLAVVILQYALIGGYIFLAVRKGLDWWHIALVAVGLFFLNALAFPFAWYALGRPTPPAEGVIPPWSMSHAHGSESVGC